MNRSWLIRADARIARLEQAMPREQVSAESRFNELDAITESLARQLNAAIERIEALEAKAHEHKGGRPPKVAE